MVSSIHLLECYVGGRLFPACALGLACEKFREQPPPDVALKKMDGGDHDSWPIQLSPACDPGRCGQAALDTGRRSAPFGRRPQPGADDEAPARHPRTSGRSAWH